jgi:hypothetical protein
VTKAFYPISVLCIAATALSLVTHSDSLAANSASEKSKAAHAAKLESQAAAEQAQLVHSANILEERIANGTTLYGDKRLDAYLQSVADKLNATLAAESKQSFRVRVRSSAEPIADALPNGAIYISYGLIGRLQSESQLALILGSEMSRCMQHAESKEAIENRSRSLRTLFPNLLLITATAGLGALAIPEWDQNARAGYARDLEVEADKLSVTMLVAAGYSGAEAGQAFSRLATTQKEEGRAYTGRFSKASILATRGTAVAADIAARAAGNAKALSDATDTASDSESFRRYQHTLSLIIADQDLRDFNPAMARLVLDRYEKELGADGRSEYLRAEAMRKNSTGAADDQSAIDSYVKATRLENVPTDAFKQLGFLYRKQGKQAEASTAFREYLKRQPNAVDAPIIKTYVE